LVIWLFVDLVIRGLRIDESPNQRIHVYAPDSSGYPFAPAFGVKDKNV